MSGTDKIIDGIIGREGKYSNHPSDRGGETMWGITVGVARENGYLGSMAAMPRETAARIYKDIYIIKPKFDQVAKIYPLLAEELIDTGVNMGVAVASMFLQQALNAFNGQGKFYPDIAEDGALGARSIAALQDYYDKRGHEGEDVIRKACDCLQGARYISIGRNRQKNEDFMYGWFRTRIG